MADLPELIVHIGAGKAGSTSLQFTLMRNAEALAAGLNALSDPEKQSAMGAAAQAALRPQADARELVGAITQRLDAAS